MSDEGAVLPRQIEKLFKQYGVIKPAGWPKLDGLLKQITVRKMRVTFEVQRDGGSTARVFAGGREFIGSDTAPERAVSRAFAQALKETEPRQLDFTGSDDTEAEPDDDDEEGAVPCAETALSSAPSPAPLARTGPATVLGRELVWNDDAGAFFDAETGERESVDPLVAVKLLGGSDSAAQRYRQ